MILADVIESLTGYRVDAPQPISVVVIDSRAAKPGSLFVALPGEQTDGHNFVAAAFQQGAVAALVHQAVDACRPEQTVVVGQFAAGQPLPPSPLCLQVNDTLSGLQQVAAFWRSKFSPKVIAITGSVGKSTTKELVWSVLSARYHTLKSAGNQNNEIGLPLTLLKLDASYERAVLEMGMYDLSEIASLCTLARPHIGVVTNVGPVHLERLGTMERITQAKSELVQALPSANEGGVAVLNYDDPRVRPMADLTSARVFTYGLSEEADLWASEVESAGMEGIRFAFHYQDDTIHARVPLLGRHSVHTALRAAAVGLVDGLAWEEIMTGLQSLPRSAQLRLVSAAGPNQSTLLDDTYNANPASTIAALNLLDDLAATRKIAVLGEMMELGSFEEEGHRKVGCRAADVVDLLITIGPRTRFLVDEARSCGLASSKILELDTNQLAVDYLNQTLEPGNIVLIKGSLSRRMGEIVSALAIQGEAVQKE
ncbi:MAG: UDP-N-acetylmuramoyl-tripeptide--D-alanyl-D-alanine ligase [Anaerolineaceae bacterium]|nr:UDP-N-acetylmuramoyl-tripeptide--D-alanyl-D-alanine ligase [Anaerolineaceae bacterium]MCB9102163.1 UDP-N-acetylmuramoyl-tripeptide--D-alanyl-D-alanine ligase [Anaerolineales bacterium]